MLQNLFENALKFTLASSIDLGLRLKNGEMGKLKLFLQSKDGHQEFDLIVQDNGIGFEGDPDRVFERFYRGQNAASITGSGLGLAIVKEVVTLHRGQVQLDSNQHGCRVTVSLPVS